MKGIFKVADKTVFIEEFSYSLDEFLKDEPVFKSPKGDLVYKQGESLAKDSGYSSKVLDLYIARKNLYRAAYKARRNGRVVEDAKPRKEAETRQSDDAANEETTPDTVTELSKKSKSKKQKGN